MSGFKEKIKDTGSTKFPYMILVVSLLLTFGITFSFYQSAKNKDQTRFNADVSRISSTIENKLNLYISLLKGGRGFIESGKNLNRESFAGYVKSLELDKNYTGIQGIGYSKVFNKADREALLKQMKDEGYKEFKLFPEGKKDIYNAIIYLEPANDANTKAIGFDMFTEVTRRTAMEKARDSGEAKASGNVTLLQQIDEQEKSGFLIYLPIYKNGVLPSTLEDRKENLIGFIYSPFKAGDFIKDINRSVSASDVGVLIYDMEAKPENLLMQSQIKQPPKKDDWLSFYHDTSDEIDVAGRKWVVESRSLDSFGNQSSVGWTPLIFISGIAFSFLFFGLTYWEVAARTKLHKTAAELFELEKQKQELLEKEQKAREIAEQANVSKNEFISIVSHELRTPLNAIAGWTRILSSDDLSSNTKKMALGKIEKNLRTQINLVEELINYSQIFSDKNFMEREIVDISELFDDVFTEIETKAVNKHLELHRENNLNGQRVLGDGNKLKIVFKNLLYNAIKFTQADGRIEIFIGEGEDENIEIKIKDNGQGIKAEFLPLIFDRFSQAEDSTTRTYGGLGLGLTISNHIIKLHNGTIEAKSKGEGKGATFVIKIPCTKDN